MIKQFNANKARLKRHMRLRNRLGGTQERPRLSVFRSGNQIYAQLIDDTTGRTLAATSSLDESLKGFKPASQEAGSVSRAEESFVVEQVQVAEEAAPSKKGARAAKAPAKAPAKGGRVTQTKTILPSAQKSERKTPIEALVAISDNYKVALAREVGKLVAQRAREKGIEQIVFDRGGYPYHGRIAALAEGAREVGLKF